MTEKENFYFQGKYFETSNELFEYANDWQNKTLNQATAERFFKRFSQDCIMNIFFVGIELTNIEFSEIIERLFQEFITMTRKPKT